MAGRRGKLPVLGCLLLATSVCLAADGSSKPHTTNPAAHSGARKAGHSAVRHKKKLRKARVHGQSAIDGERARQIQQALIREHYLNGEPSGNWDPSTEHAMQRYQADQGWQTKTVPDSRALIRLGLGPDNEHLLNPESAMTSQPRSQSANSPAAQKLAGTSGHVPAVAAMPASAAPVSSSPSPSGTSRVPVR